MAPATRAPHGRSRGSVAVEGVDRLVDEDVPGLRDEQHPDGVDVEETSRRVDQYGRRRRDGGQPHPARRCLDHLVGRACRLHRLRAIDGVDAADHTAAHVQYRCAHLRRPAGEAVARRHREADEVRFGVGETEDPRRAGRPLAHRGTGAFEADDVHACPQQAGGGGQADDPCPDHRYPHSREGSGVTAPGYRGSRGPGADRPALRMSSLPSGRVPHAPITELSVPQVHRPVVVARTAMEVRGARVLGCAVENMVAVLPPILLIVLHPELQRLLHRWETGGDDL